MPKKPWEGKRKEDDPKGIAADSEWGKRQFTKCKHGKLSAATQVINTSKQDITWHAFWTARVHVGYGTCGAEQFFNWSRNEHGKDASTA